MLQDLEPHTIFYLLFFLLTCAVSIVTSDWTIFKFLNFQSYYLHYSGGSAPLIYLSINQFIACMFSVGLAVGVMAAVGGLLYIQVSHKTFLHKFPEN